VSGCGIVVSLLDGVSRTGPDLQDFEFRPRRLKRFFLSAFLPHSLRFGFLEFVLRAYLESTSLRTVARSPLRDFKGRIGSSNHCFAEWLSPRAITKQRLSASLRSTRADGTLSANIPLPLGL